MKLAVRSDGGSGHSVVLLHGFPGNGADWEPVAELLATTSRVIVVDLLGFGESPRPSSFSGLWVDAQAGALHETLAELGLDHVALVGHDFGGPVAITFLRHFPGVTHLSLLSTNTFGDTPVDFPLSLVRQPLLAPLIEPLMFHRLSLTMLGRAASNTPGVSPERNDRREARAVRTIFGTVLRDLPSLYADVEQQLAAIDIPTTVIWGDRDMFFPLEQGRRTADAIPNARFVVLEGCGHFPPIERTEDVAREIGDLIAG